jgi:hypothetical protein
MVVYGKKAGFTLPPGRVRRSVLNIPLSMASVDKDVDKIVHSRQ